MISPQPGPQTAFAASSADVCIFASQPGSGKSTALCLEALRWTHKPNYTGVLMRSSYKDLVRGPTSLFGQLSYLGRQLGGRPRQSPHPGVEFSSPSSVLCLHGNTDKAGFDGLEIAMLGLDEAAHFDLPLVQYIVGSRMRTTCGIRPYVRGTVMPTADTWVHDLVRPWLDGPYARLADSGKVRYFFWDNRNLPQIFDTLEDAQDAARVVDPAIKPRSLAFVFARTSDNAVLMHADPGYVERLAMLPPHERERLLHGSWEARPETAGLFDRSAWRVLDQAPGPKQIRESVRGWDLAATKPSDTSPDPDWTRGVRLDVLLDGTVCVSDVVSLRDRPGPVDDLIRATARQDGPRCHQAFSRDPGSAGVRDEQHIRDMLSKVTGIGRVLVQPAANKEALGRVWSTVLSDGRMVYARAAWNGPYLAELDAFPGRAHDDQVDATSYAFRELTGLGKPASSTQLLLARVTGP